MISSTITLIILSSASALRSDLSILFSRSTLASFILTICDNFDSTFFRALQIGLTLYNGLYQCNTITHIFSLFTLGLSYMILSLTSYYPRKAGLTKDANRANYPELLTDRANQLELLTEDSFFSPLARLNTARNITETRSDIDNSMTDELRTYETRPDIMTDKLRIDKTLDKNPIFHLKSDKPYKSYAIDKTSSQFKILEYPLLILFVLCGAIFLISTNDIISIFISIELQSYGLYLLSSVYRNSESSTKAGLTYFLLGGLSSCIILLAQGLLYVNSGSTNLENIYILSNASIIGIIDALNSINGMSYINICLIVLSVGFLFKVSAAPFHFWSPDVYDGVPTLVTTFIAIIAKISIFVFLLELVHYTSNNQIEQLTYNWSNNLLISALLSLIVGSVLGLTQFRIKRLYAYSTISHVGFILLALSINSTESIQAFIFYLIQYSVSNLNAFIILLAIGYFFINYYEKDGEYNILKERNNSPIQLITQIKGLYKLNAMLSLSFAITLFSFLGVPPLLGFFGKQMVLSASLDSGYVFMSLIAILTSVISAVYYLILVKQMFFYNTEYDNIDTISGIALERNNNTVKKPIVKKPEPVLTDVKLSSSITTMISILTLLTLVFIFVSSLSLNLTQLLSLYVMGI